MGRREKMTSRPDKDAVDRSPFVPHGRMPDPFTLVGVGRRGKDDAAFREDVRRSLAAAHADARREEVDGFLGRVFYHRADFTTAEGLAGLGRRLGELEGAHGLPGNRLFYLATDPEFFVPLIAA